jgi:hypothetical protein
MNRALVAVGLAFCLLRSGHAEEAASGRPLLSFRVPHAYRDKTDPLDWGAKVVVNPYVAPAWPLETLPASPRETLPASPPNIVRLPPKERTDLR